jgi:hypothetical protein
METLVRTMTQEVRTPATMRGIWYLMHRSSDASAAFTLPSFSRGRSSSPLLVILSSASRRRLSAATRVTCARSMALVDSKDGSSCCSQIGHDVHVGVLADRLVNARVDRQQCLFGAPAKPTVTRPGSSALAVPHASVVARSSLSGLARIRSGSSVPVAITDCPRTAVY